MKIIRESRAHLKQSAADRFEAHTDKSGPIPEGRPALGRCWEWTAGRFRSGYGAFHPKHGETVIAHRYAYESLMGSIPRDLVVDHLCRNRGCVNPEHLELVTNQENLRRGSGYRLRNGMTDKCINGHLYTPANTYTNRNNPTDIRCRECSRIRDRKRAS